MIDKPLTIRPARETDLFEIVEMLADDPLGATREDMRDPLPEAYHAALSAIENDPNQLLAEAVRVARDHRGSKLGEAMFSWAISECRARGCSLVQLTRDKTRRDAHRFYARLGFESTHFGYKLAL